MALVEPLAEESDFRRTVDLLGGPRVLHRTVRSALDTHDLLHEGLPARALDHLVREVTLLHVSPVLLEKAVGISPRTYQRRKKDEEDRPLSREQSNRVWKFAETLGRASDLFGSQAAAEAWLVEPATALDQRKPIDLLSTPAGVEMVEAHLTRIEYGVYT